ncbi:MAG: hypothetical protein ABSA54_00335 [Terriglobales bacterium]|jgi:hypothetical protein
MVNAMSLFSVNVELPLHISYFPPKAVASRGHRYSEQLGDSLPIVAGDSESQDGAVSFTEFSNDVFQIQSRVYLTAPTMVYGTTRQLNRPTSRLNATGLGGESPKRPRESQQKQSVLSR